MTEISTRRRVVSRAASRLVCTASILLLLQWYVPATAAWAAGSGPPTTQPGESGNGPTEAQSEDKQGAGDKQAADDKKGNKQATEDKKDDKQSADKKAGVDAWKNDDKDLWSRFNLLGDIGGLRAWMLDHGMTLGIAETSEVLANVTGGIRQGAIYEGVTDLNFAWDLRPDFGWRGQFFARAYQIHGRGLSANNLGNLNIASGIEADRATRLYELWYEHHFGDWLRIRLGQQSASQEFLISTNAKLFVNSTFGWPTLPGTDLPSGGPNYPLGTPAVRFRVDANDALTFFVGVFNGSPTGAPAGAMDPQRGDLSGTAFRIGDSVFAIFETRYNPDNSPKNGTYRLGAWYNSEKFSDQHFASNGVSLASPLSSGMSRQLSNDYSVYAILDQPIFPAKDENDDTGWNVFGRIMGVPSDRNLVDFYFDTGLEYKGPFGRPNDTVGLAYGYARIGNSARQLDMDFATTGTFRPVRSTETVVELTYQFTLNPWWQLQADFQYITDPGAGISNPNALGRKIGNAAVPSLRTIIQF